jgi:hypothetical protein
VASRQDEKERRRQERLAREQAEARSAANHKRLQLVGGGVLAFAAIAAVVIALVTGLGGGDEAPKVPDSDAAKLAAAKLPDQTVTDLEDAAKAAGCTLKNPRYEGADHEDRKFKPADYKTNPPTSGNHNPVAYQDGIYEPGTIPMLGQVVHTLEHGRIDIQYRKGTPKSVVAQLETFVGENEGYHMVMFENTTDMKPQVAATAWTHSLTCDEMNPKVFDALRTFRDKYLDKGPEKIP